TGDRGEGHYPADTRAVAHAVRRADVSVLAGRPGGLEGAGRRAAVAGERVAVVALLAGLEEAVPAKDGELPDEHVELLGLKAPHRETGAAQVEEVGPTRAAGHRLRSEGGSDVPRCGRHGARQEAQEGGHLAVERGGEGTGDGAHVVAEAPVSE